MGETSRRWNPSRTAPRTRLRTTPRTTARRSTLPPPSSSLRHPPARRRCPLRWNHAGICSVQILPGRTRRARSVRNNAALNPPPPRNLGEVEPAELPLAAEPLVAVKRELPSPPASEPAPPASAPPPPAQAGAEPVALSQAEGSGAILARRSSAAFDAAFSRHPSAEAPRPSAPNLTNLAEADDAKAATEAAAPEAGAPETEAVAEAETGGGGGCGGGGSSSGGGGGGGGGGSGGASGFKWEVIVVQDASGAQQTLFHGPEVDAQVPRHSMPKSTAKGALDPSTMAIPWPTCRPCIHSCDERTRASMMSARSPRPPCAPGRLGADPSRCEPKREHAGALVQRPAPKPPIAHRC